MRRIVVTGANGAGKSTFAAELQRARPEVPVVSLDRIKLTRAWQRRAPEHVQADLREALSGESWILDTGPSGLTLAMQRAEALVWLDVPRWRRGVRLFLRPVRHRGRTRAELPPGNPDRVLEQWRFGWRSVVRQDRFDAAIEGAVDGFDGLAWRCRTRADREEVVAAWAGG